MSTIENKPLLSLNSISTKLNVEDAIKQYYEAGFDGIGLWNDEVFAYGVDRILDLLNQYPIKVTHVIYVGPFNQTNEIDFMKARAKDRETIKLAGKLHADSVLAMTGGINGLSKSEAFRQLNRSLRELLDCAKENGVKIGLEPLHYNLQNDSFLFTLKDAMDIIEEIDDESLGVFLDVFHIWQEPGVLETLARTKNKIVGVHLCDQRQINRTEYDRVLMGDGVIPVRLLIEEFRKQGWNSWYDIEIFSDELWAKSPQEFFQLVKEKYDKLWVNIE